MRLPGLIDCYKLALELRNLIVSVAISHATHGHSHQEHSPRVASAHRSLRAFLRRQCILILEFVGCQLVAALRQLGIDSYVRRLDLVRIRRATSKPSSVA